MRSAGGWSYTHDKEDDPRIEYDVREEGWAHHDALPGADRPEFWRPGGSILVTRSSCLALLDGIVESLRQATGRFLEEEVYLIVRALATWAADLPASERNHHARPFGLLDHSLDVAHRFIAWAARSRTVDAFRRRWLFVGVSLALFHDIGKLRDLLVEDPASREVWDPFVEPVTHFRLRHDRPSVGVEDSSWRPGRGAHTHDEDLYRLVDVVLPPDFTPAFRRDLLNGLYAVACRSPKRLEGYPWPLPYLSVAVRHADGESASFRGVSR
jgi:hypothetical protein